MPKIVWLTVLMTCSLEWSGARGEDGSFYCGSGVGRPGYFGDGRGDVAIICGGGDQVNGNVKNHMRTGSSKLITTIPVGTTNVSFTAFATSDVDLWLTNGCDQAVASECPASSAVKNGKFAVAALSMTAGTLGEGVINEEVKGNNVVKASFNSGAAFVKVSGTKWSELRASGDEAYQFEETGNDEWSVYLLDNSRGVEIRIDLWKRQIIYSDRVGNQFVMAAIESAKSHFFWDPEGHSVGGMMFSGDCISNCYSGTYHVREWLRIPEVTPAMGRLELYVFAAQSFSGYVTYSYNSAEVCSQGSDRITCQECPEEWSGCPNGIPVCDGSNIISCAPD